MRSVTNLTKSRAARSERVPNAATTPLRPLQDAKQGSGDGDSTSSEALPLSVEGLLEAEPSGSVEAIGFVVIDSAGFAAV